MTTEPVDPAELLSAEPLAIPEFPDPPPRRLPLNRMPWEHFERLCALLLADMDANILQVFRYGSNAQGQGGIDIIGTLKDSDDKVVVECKRVQTISSREITFWVSRFLEKMEISGIRRFIFAVTADVRTDKRLLNTWMSECERLRQRNIQGVLWDFGELEIELAARPNLIEFFFGVQAEERFGRRMSVSNDWPAAYRKQAELVIDRSVVVENLTVRVNMLLLTELEPNFAPILMFARADLRGLPQAISSNTFTQWMQWAAYAPSLDKAPFLLADSSEPNGGAFLQAGSGMPRLQRNEIKHLHWLLARSWSHYMGAVRQIDRIWKVRRFPVRRKDDGQQTYGMCTVTEEFWHAILAYTEKFDSDKGQSDEHIFNAHRTGIMVYVGQCRAGLQPGFHVNLPASKEASYGLGSQNRIRISWKVVERFKTLTYSPDQVWDAEYAHDWLMQSFLPRVLAWALEQERKSMSAMQRFRGAVFGRRVPDMPLEAAACSLADELVLSDALSLATHDEARRAIARLLSYFESGGTGEVGPYIDAAAIERLRALGDAVQRDDVVFSPNQLQRMAQELQPLWTQLWENSLRAAYS